MISHEAAKCCGRPNSGIGLSGCGSAGGLKSADSSSGKLVVWDWKSSDANAANYVAKAKADLAKKHPNVTVEFVAQPFDQYYTARRAIQAGKGPDVMLFNGGGQLRDHALVSRSTSTSPPTRPGLPAGRRSQEQQDLRRAVRLQGHPIYYNKALYEKAGLNPDKPATTWPEFLSNCATISKATGTNCWRWATRRATASSSSCRASARGSSARRSTPLDRRQAQLGVARRQEDFQLWKEAGDAGLNTDGANSTAMFMDVFGLFQGGKSSHVLGLMSDVGALEGLQRVPHADEGRRHDGAGHHPRGHAGLPYDGGVGYGVAKWTKDPSLAADLVGR